MFALTIAVMTLMTGCTGRGQAGKSQADMAANDSADIAAEEQHDTVPQPMFVTALSDNDVLLYYWTGLNEPVKDEYNAEDFDAIHKDWVRQETFRRNAAAYTHLILSDGTACKVKFREEHITNPDGDTIEVGVIHYRPEVPNCGAYLDAVAQEIKASEAGVIVTDEYLNSHQPLTVSDVDNSWENVTPMPTDIVKKLEQEYGMKASRSQLLSRIGEDYTYGYVQFKGEWKNAPKNRDFPDRRHCLAVDVLSDGQKLYVHEQKGYYESEDDFGWNVDDVGEYLGCSLIAAFQSNDGLSLCYYRAACESLTVGIFSAEGERLKETFETSYYSMIDEDIPVWKSDIAEMQRLFIASNPESLKGTRFTQWAHIAIDYSNEWIWMKDAKADRGAIFQRKEGKFKLIAQLPPNRTPLVAHWNATDYLLIKETPGGDAWHNDLYVFANGELTDHFHSLCDADGIKVCEMNGQEVDPEIGQVYMNKLPEFQDVTVYFTDIKP